MTVWSMCIACWIPKATNAHSEYVLIILFFHCNSGCMNVPHCYVILMLPALYIFIYS